MRIIAKFAPKPGSDFLDSNGDGSTGAVTDDYTYDAIGRLDNYKVSAPSLPGLQRSVTLQYNALGSLLHKSDVGSFSYPAQGGARPHAVQTVIGPFSSAYTYDGNGNLKTASGGSYRGISYTSFNMPDSQSGVQGPGGGSKYTWQYDENYQRIKETRASASGTRTTWMIHPDNAGGLSFESEQAGSVVSNRNYLFAGGTNLGVLVSSGSLPVLQSGQTTPPPLGSISLNKAEYWHKDHLGSVATTSHNGEVTARYAYDPFGKRRMTAGSYDADGNLVMDWANTAGGTDRGYTGHEHLDDVGLVHMNGRIFDPRLSIFMQGDPFNQDPTNLQNYNRYAYCYSNPTTCTDPTGNFSIFGVKILPGIFNNRNLKIGAIILVSYLTYGAASEYVMAQYGITATAYAGAGTAAAAGAAATSVAGATASGIASFSVATVSGVAGGFAAGFTGSLIGSDGDIKAAMQGGFSGAISGGVNAFYGAQYLCRG